MKVPFLDLTAAYQELRHELDDATHRVLARGRYILGDELTAFETEFAEYSGAKHCVGVGNGLDALELSLRAMGVGPGDEVIVPSNTYIATWLAVMGCGARPVPIEPETDTYNLSPDATQAVLTPRSRAIIPVHLYGQPAAMDAVIALAQHHSLWVLADAAQAHGAHYRSKPVGALGDACAWSFYPSKNLGALGDGGAVTTDSAELAAQIRLLSNYGSSSKDIHTVAGRNSRLDELQAALLRVKLARLDDWNERRRQIATRYFQTLKYSSLILPCVPDWASPVWHLFVVRSPLRDLIRQRLTDFGVETQIHYPTPPHQQPACRHLGLDPERFPVAERLHREVFSLPISPHLSDAQLESTLQALTNTLAELDG